MVLPWHPRLNGPRAHEGVHFHPFHYSPIDRWHVFGYAGALQADVVCAGTALLLRRPHSCPAGEWRGVWLAIRRDARARTLGRSGRCDGRRGGGLRPLVVSLHGSDVYVAERHWPARVAARQTLRRARAIVACSEDLRQRAIGLGADPSAIETVPYGVDTGRFAPDPGARTRMRAAQDC